MLANGLQIRKDLAWMLDVRECVDHRNICGVGKFNKRVVGVDASGDDIRVAAENARDILRRLPPTEPNFLRQHAEAVAAHLAHPEFEADTRAQRRLFKQQDKAAARQIRSQFACPDCCGSIQHGANLFGREIGDGQEMAAGCLCFGKCHRPLILLPRLPVDLRAAQSGACAWPSPTVCLNLTLCSGTQGSGNSMQKQGLLSARFLPLITTAALMLALLVTACGTGSELDDSGDGRVDSPTATTTETAVPTVSTPDATPTAVEEAVTPESGGSVDIETPSGGLSATLQEESMARYLIREELAGVELPFDAMGETSEVSGAFTFSADGEIVPESSRIVLNAASLRSDEENRDRYISRNAIQTATYPEIVFVATSVDGLAWPLPSSGEAEFTIYGDLTVREVTRPVAWQTVATFDGTSVTGTARTNFTFGEFEMEVPDLFFIVSLEDNIRLELDFVAGW